MSDNLQRYLQKLRTLIERDFSVSLMNDTKWNEALAALREFRLRYRVKLITYAEPTRWGWLNSGSEHRLPPGWVEGSGCGGPVRVLEIEWLELEPFTRVRRGEIVDDLRIDHTEEIEELLGALGVPYVWEDSVIRIRGYIRR